MNKKIKIFTTIMLFIAAISLYVVRPNNKTLASNNLQVMTTSSGTELKYRNSSEKVYGLAKYDYPTAEYRAAWVSTFVGDIPSFTTEEKFKSDATIVLDNLVKMGMNAIVFHVRTHNNALYRSDLNPVASWWNVVDFDKFDPLTWFIDECHNRGMEFHAWMNPYRVDMKYIGEPYPTNHPCNDSNLLLSNGSATILDPASEVVQDFIVDTCMEFLDRYDADAIHFDDYFYISGVATSLSGNQKRANVNAFIKKLSDKMHAMNIEEGRAVQLGISPSGIYRNGGYTASPTYDANGTLISPVSSNTSGFAHYDNYLYSDTKYWIDNEWIDYITPQTYWGMEHKGANFYELSKWWSWCVKYKKTNLYLGMGIYMAESTGSSAAFWKRNENEVKNQILNGSMYEEVNGFCLYKYSTLLNKNNTIIQNGVNLITNDYWNKRVPGVVIKRYADTIPSIEVTNLSLNNTTLSWTKIDNVFGYVVYEVPKGYTLDQNNIDYVKKYTQDTSIQDVNTTKYDYYVSSVNRANVISTPTKFGSAQATDYEQVIALINELPANITYKDLKDVQQIRALYNNLSDENKAKVINYDILVSAELTIKTLNNLKTKAEKFVKNLNTHISENRILPVGENMKWSYVASNDANSYNITTGKRLKNYLCNYIIKLNLEVSQGNIVYKHEVSFDLGLVKNGQIGLVYRNDPSAMSKDHVGQYTDTTSYIGWSNVTLTVGNKVLFIAVNNYHELTSNNIPSCNWTSCAGVYTNKSNANITLSIGDAFETETPTYGYLVVGSNNKVKKVDSNSASSVKITLQPNETLMIVRYLDRIINDTPFSTVTDIAVGTDAYITHYDNITVNPQDEGEVVVALINALPTTITLADEEAVNKVKNAYDALSTDAKAYVTNLATLTNAINKIKELKNKLQTLMDAAIKDLNEYVDLSKYSSSAQSTIKNYLSKAEKDILNATTENEINAIVEMTKNKIDDVKTLEQELISYRARKINELNNYVDLSQYDATNKAKIESYLEAAKGQIENATSTIMIDQIVSKTKSKINSLQTTEEQIIDARNKACAEIENYRYDSDFSSNIKNKQNEIVYDALTKINSSTSIEQINEIVIEAKRLIDALPTRAEELKQAKEAAIQEIEEFVKLEELDSTIQALVTKHMNDAKTSIQNADTNKEITTAVDKYKQEVQLLVVMDYAKKEKAALNKTIDYTAYTKDIQDEIKACLNTIVENITYQTTKNDIDTRVQATKERISEITKSSVELVEKKQEVKEFLESLLDNDLSNSKKTKITNLVNTKKEELAKATSLEEIEQIKSTANSEYQKILNEKENTSNCNNKTAVLKVLSMITLMATTIILLKKRH